jgi:hypothetical protein
MDHPDKPAMTIKGVIPIKQKMLYQPSPSAPSRR